MRRLSWRAGALALLALAAPAAATIKFMDLRDLMQVTDDCLDAQIVAKQTFRVDDPDYEGMVFTKIRVVGESMRTGETIETDLVYTGSHDPADQYGSSEMPLFQDVRLGNRVVLFFGVDEANKSGRNQVWAWNCAYRVETVLGQPIVIGKGEGFAFTQNVTLAQAREQVRQTHLALEAEAQATVPVDSGK